MFKLGVAVFLLAISVAALGAECIRPSSDVVNGVNLRAQPTTDSSIRGLLAPGQSLPLVAAVPYWYETQTSDGQPAFLSKRWTEVGDCAQPTPPAPGGPSFTIDVFDVGTGLSVLVRGADFALLYDGGSNDDLATGAKNRVIAYLKAETPPITTLDDVVLSHPHRDHVDLLPDVIRTYKPADVWDSGSHGNMICAYWRFLRAVAAGSSIHYHTATQGAGDETVSLKDGQCSSAQNRSVTLHHASRIDNAPMQIGTGASMQFLYADGTPYSNSNRNSLVVRFTLGSHHALFMGDAPGGPRALPTTPPAANSIEAKLLQCCKQNLAADVLIVGHHGSETSSRSAFINAVGARIYAISSGPKKYGPVMLPDHVIETELKAHGELFETTEHDAQCALSAAKIGPDHDGKPGGCDAIHIVIPSTGPITMNYMHEAD